MFSIAASFDETNPNSPVECVVSTGDMTPTEAMMAMVRFRDHITARIEAAPKECPIYKQVAEIS